MSAGSKQVHIIGCGISGLVAAHVLEKSGFHPVMYDVADKVGGRIKTTDWHGTPLDHGFQVLLTEYPMCKKYLDYGALDLANFAPGAHIYFEGKRYMLGDFMRNYSMIWQTLSFPLASMGDKWKMYQLSQQLKNKSLDDIFSEPELTTIDYLEREGFSEGMIVHFLQPFYTGIFLEDQLQTSSRMFEFVFSLFSKGFAAIPRSGMEAIAVQLATKLEHSDIHLKTSIEKVISGHIIFSDGKKVKADYVLIATDPTNLLKGYPELHWTSSTTVYFEADSPLSSTPIISLITDREALVNNFHFVTNLIKNPLKKSIVSATIVRHGELTEDFVVKRAKDDLERFAGITGLRHIDHFRVEKALPRLKNIVYAPSEDDVLHRKGIYLAGDYLANGSINAAMASGEKAARKIIADCTD